MRHETVLYNTPRVAREVIPKLRHRFNEWEDKWWPRDTLADIRKPAPIGMAALASEASGQRGFSKVRAHSASEDPRERADDTRPEPGSSGRAAE
jgi:hypothetical protein